MIFPRRRPASALFASAALLLAAPSFADAPAASLVRVLASPGRPHPLADAHGRVPFTVVLPTGISAASLGLLEVAPGVGAARLPPSELVSFAADHPELYLGLEPPRRPLLDVSRTWIHLDQFRAKSGNSGDGKGVVVGVVDTGIDIHHPDFLDKNGKTRIAWLLNAEPPRGLHPDLEHAFGCDDPKQSQCAVYNANDIDALIAQGSTAIHDAEGHGTHVTSIAAGNGGISIHPKPKYAGIAPAATLVIAAPSTDGGFFDEDVLRAARFVFDRADALAQPVVCNLSLGGDFGPHDGTSALEHGLSGFVGDDKPGHAIVVAAGNSGALVDFGDGPSSGVHTEARVTPGGITRVPVRSSQSTTGQGFVWITFRPGDVVDVALEGPDGSRWVGFQSPGDEAGYDDKEGTTAGVVNNHVGKSSSITADTNSAVVVVQGKWANRSEFNVLLRGSGDASLWIVGTGDVGPGEHSGIVFERAIRQGTVTVPASAPGLLAVGCTMNRLQWKPLGSDPIVINGLTGDDKPEADGACYFSASGPTPLGVIKPEISAPGGFVVAAMSSEADPRKSQGALFDSSTCPAGGPKDCYLVDAQHAVAIGTSMSAPHAAGAVALLMQIDPTLTQGRVTDILEAGARKPQGSAPFDYQIGPGVLDLEGALQALGGEPAGGPAPDLSKSWYTLSSSYAQPDAAFPVWGTIELRRADGTLAGGLDGTMLSVVVKNGEVVRPLVKVRHGLFRFAVAGAAGHVGEALTVEVRYGDGSLGVRTLPIGTDVWTTDGVINAVGGCSIGSAATPIGWASGLILASGFGLALARRRYRARRSMARRLTSKSC